MPNFIPDTNKWYVIIDHTDSISGWYRDRNIPWIEFSNAQGYFAGWKYATNDRVKASDTRQEAELLMKKAIEVALEVYKFAGRPLRGSLQDLVSGDIDNMRVVSGKEITVMLVKHRIRMASR